MPGSGRGGAWCGGGASWCLVRWDPAETAGRTLTAPGALALPHPAASKGWLSSCGPAAPPPVFVLEYYLDTLWKGMLLFVVCLFLISFGIVSQV